MSTATLEPRSAMSLTETALPSPSDPSDSGAPGALTTTEHNMTLPDGLRLFYRRFLPASGFDRALIMLHRGHEHSGRLADVARQLIRKGTSLERTAIFAWDARGHGCSGGRRGHASSFAQLVRDLDCFVHQVTADHDLPLARIAVLGQSVGGVIAATWVHDYAPPIEKLVLVTPAFRVRLYVPFALPALRLWQRLKGRRPGTVKSYVRGRMLTRDRDEAARYDTDPLITRDISIPVLLGLREAADRVVADAAAIQVPTLVLTGGADLVVDQRVQSHFVDQLGSTVKAQHTMPGMFHDLLHERDRIAVLNHIRDFLGRQSTSHPSCPAILNADRAGFTRDEYDRLQRPLPPWAPHAIGYRLLRIGMSTVGRMSDGIALGFATGFDSGLSLDHVYRNRATGRFGIGRLFDRLYLDSPGWRGIRQRRVHLRTALERAIASRVGRGRPVSIVDLACGGGRYVIDALSGCAPEAVVAILRDVDARNVAAARALADRRGLENVRAEVGDAFDPASIATLAPRPDIVIVSGLYELFPDNERVRRSLAAVAAGMAPDGCLIVTNQPWHPQIELIARTLTNREGRPWIMRRRTQAEMDALVAEAGFEKQSTAIDDAGIFTVSVADRRSLAPSEAPISHG